MEPGTGERSTSGISGKVVIVSILSVALLSAAVSWLFRYSATHGAVKFWGPEAATIIRDAPVVTVYRAENFQDPATAAVMKQIKGTDFEISNAHGLTHLRNALLEDHNFDWSTVDNVPSQTSSKWGLMFADPKAGKSTTIWLSDDFQKVSRENDATMRSVTVDPIMAKGLREMFAEFSAQAAKQSTHGGQVPAR